ncbi:MAG: HD domain-containing protein [Candidatus Shapirobacteria bacterium]|jgi:GTP pyrophosphokinase
MDFGNMIKGSQVDGIVLESDKLVRAYNLALEAHGGQVRKSGEPYFSHCMAVLKILHDEWKIGDEKFLIAALLHDGPEDTTLSLNQIRLEFGEEVTELVEGVTKLRAWSDRETLTKVLGRTFLNPGVAVMKLADRLHNMRTLNFMEADKQREKAAETLGVYTRLAESLGMWRVKNELEDWGFRYLEPKNFEKVKEQIDGDRRLDEQFLGYVKSSLEQLLMSCNYRGKVEMRRSGYWASKKKRERLAMQGKGETDNFFHINDVVSFRIILAELDDCYLLLGRLHEKYGGLVDFDKYKENIGANKRENGYQAIQTTIGFSNGPVEIALVTQEMEDFNNWGVVDMINQGQKNLKAYVLKPIFTPLGKVRFLPKDATAIDFAADLNPGLLAQAISCRVNGEEKPLSWVLPSASVVELVLGEPKRAPIANAELFSLAPTKRMIENLRMLEKRMCLVENGRELIEEVLRPRGLLALTDLGEIINRVLFDFGCESIEELHFLVGNGSLGLPELSKDLDARGITKDRMGWTTIRLTGLDNPGILRDIVEAISKTGRNIVRTDLKKQKEMFNLRIIVEKMTKDEEEYLRKLFEPDERFATKMIV